MDRAPLQKRPRLAVGKAAAPDAPCLCSHAAVTAHFAFLQPGDSQPVDAVPVVVLAQVVHKRPLSARLVFIDLRFEGEEAGTEGETTLEAILKPRGALLPQDRAKELRHALRLGDRVRALVCAERMRAEKGGALMLHICGATVERSWAEEAPGRCFLPDKSWHVRGDRAAATDSSGTTDGAVGAEGAPIDVGGALGRGTARPASSSHSPIVLEAPVSSSAAVGQQEQQEQQQQLQQQQQQPQEHSALAGKVGDGAVAQLELCKFFVNTGACERGAACPWRHPPPSEIKAARAMWVAARRARKGGTARQEDDPHATEDKREKTRRAAMFVAWLVETFGEARLRGGTGVLDIAGGRGDVSFELANVCDPPFPCLLLEPRPRKLSKPQRRTLAKSGRVDGVQQVQAMLDDALLAKPDFAATFAGAAALVGMHPDQATEPIVDQALARGKPFAVVPCCVFAREAAAAGLERRTPEGKEVSTYEELLEYLAAKDPGIQRAYLGFRGRNCVLYKL